MTRIEATATPSQSRVNLCLRARRQKTAGKCTADLVGPPRSAPRLQPTARTEIRPLNFDRDDRRHSHIRVHTARVCTARARALSDAISDPELMLEVVPTLTLAPATIAGILAAVAAAVQLPWPHRPSLLCISRKSASHLLQDAPATGDDIPRLSNPPDRDVRTRVVIVLCQQQARFLVDYTRRPMQLLKPAGKRLKLCDLRCPPSVLLKRKLEAEQEKISASGTRYRYLYRTVGIPTNFVELLHVM